MKLSDREKQCLIGMATTLAIYDVAEQEDYLKIMEIYAKAIERETERGKEANK